MLSLKVSNAFLKSTGIHMENSRPSKATVIDSNKNYQCHGCGMVHLNSKLALIKKLVFYDEIN